MNTPIVSTTRPVLADVPVEMPIDILLALPEYVTRDPAAPVFNLPGAIALLLGQFGWERASKILRPWIWAPGWDDGNLERFVTSPFLDHPELYRGRPTASLRVSDFPGTGAPYHPPIAAPPFDIVQFIGHVGWKDGERAIKLVDLGDHWIDAPALTSALLVAKTRLLILQVPNRHVQNATELSKKIVDAGVPAAIVVAARDPAMVNAYLTGLYADLVHNKDLEEVGRPKLLVEQEPPLEPSVPLDLVVQLIHGHECGDILQFNRWLNSLERRLGQLRAEAANRAVAEGSQINQLRSQLLRRTLHQSQVMSLEAKLLEAEQRIPKLSSMVEEISGALQGELSFAHESGGAEPLSRIAELVPALEAEVGELQRVYSTLDAEVAAAEQHAPRVLNANFGYPTSGSIVQPLEGLVAVQEYDLLMDIGPVWNTIPSIVGGSSAFPEQALPPDGDGHRIDVVFVSSDFAPELIAGRIWLPRHRGRSHPFVDGRPAPRSGPIALRIRAPGFPPDNAGLAREAHGRLFLYYANNLLQSAAVSAGVIREAGVALERPNRVDVDFALTASFQELQERYAQRELRLAPGDPRASRPIAVNITLNQDGRGTHRILVRGRDDAKPAWMAYDPAAARTTLDKGRAALLDCYWERSENGGFVSRGGERVKGLNEGNGKALNQFLLDLFFLAKVGRSLYNEAFLGLRADDGSDPEPELSECLSTSQVIQIARIESTPTQYAYPWALLYAYPLPGTADQIRWCDVVWEWSDDGVRAKPPGLKCPFEDQSWHRENVLCPYGFWGLKHIIEQPLAPAAGQTGLNGATKDLVIGETINLSVAWTRDATLDLSRIDAHVQTVSRIHSVRLSAPRPNPADDRDSVRAVLAIPKLVYFLCHCERDPTENEPYLYVGPRDGQERRKIYVNTVRDWTPSTLAGWGSLRPLVFLNGCHTSDLKPGEVLNFVSAFGRAGAAGIIGTEVSVPVPVATEIAERLFEKLVSAGRLGQAMREMRWELANKGNLFGLCYTPYGLADLHLVRR